MEEERMSEFRGAHSIATWRSEVEDEYCSLDLGRRDGEKEGGGGGSLNLHWSELNHTKGNNEKKQPRTEFGSAKVKERNKDQKRRLRRKTPRNRRWEEFGITRAKGKEN